MTLVYMTTYIHVKFIQTVTILLHVDDDDDASELNVVIGGAVGGAVLLVILFVLYCDGLDQTFI